jgi:hypothetical protein
MTNYVDPVTPHVVHQQLFFPITMWFMIQHHPAHDGLFPAYLLV